MRLRITSFAVALLLTLLTAPAFADLQAGTLLNGTITENYSSNHAYVGQPVKLTHVTNDNGSGTVTGGTLYGTVSSVQAAGQGRPGRIAFSFTRLVLPSGATYRVNTTVTKMAANTKSNALKEAGGALAGMLVGNMIGKTLFHTGIGGVVGAAGGFLAAKNNRENVNVSSGSVVQVQVNSITRRQAGHG
jgi:hypothetical protein